MEFVDRSRPGENLKPADLLFPVVCFFDRRIEDAHARGPDVRPGAVPANERNDRLVRDLQLSLVDGNFFAWWRRDVFVRHKAATVSAGKAPVMFLTADYPRSSGARRCD